MAEENNRPPEDQNPPVDETPQEEAPVEDNDTAQSDPDPGMADRLERLGGEPAPAISPEEFARLQQSGQIHIDSRGRVRTTRREKTDAGMSLRKRRAWYAQ